MSVPAVVIAIRLEATGPTVYIDAINDAAYLRLDDWLRQKPKLAALVRLALELEHEASTA